ncbi:hypothetical protein C8R46DRAFT_898032 [Mycena filopes]|nr:hypothetical protein C8R46DRAFT_898032 [Mycena filopes]
MGGAQSSAFTSDIGVLTGDPASPTFWDLFFADFHLNSDDPDDVVMAGVVMSHLEHADDMAVVSYTPEGLQRHLDTFAHWCGDNLLEANAGKSWIMVFGPIPNDVPVFTLNGLEIGYKENFCYVGMTFQSTTKNIFAAHYSKKASTARGTAYSVLGLESYVGDLPPKEGRLLYMACIDPHLISAADVMVDVDDTALAKLEKVQTSFLRRLLGLGQFSMRAPLFTELGLIPLRYRRITIALRYLRYLTTLKATHYARIALEDSYQLFLHGHQGYWMDLAYALGKLRFPVTLPALPTLTVDTCNALTKAVHTAAMRDLQADIDGSTRLYLLHGRLEPLEDDAPRAITVVLRHYLTMVVNARHRKALTRMLLSQHPLAIERLRYKKRRHTAIVPRPLRQCRFGCGKVETVEHALFFCERAEGVGARRITFVIAVSADVPAVLTISPATAPSTLKALVFNRSTVCQVAKFAHFVFGVFSEVPLEWPEGF